VDEDAFVAPGPTLLCAVSEGDYLGKDLLVKRIVLTLIHHQDIICCVAFLPEAGRRSLLLAAYRSIRLSRRSLAPCI